MAKDVEMLGVLVEPAQKAKVRRWAAAANTDMSTVVRILLDNVEMEIKPTFVTAQPSDPPVVVVSQT